MRAAILAIGDEIVGGLTVDTNSSFIAERLRATGVEPVAGFSAPDDEKAIERAFERALEEAEVAIATGGLGPTADDLTTACVARLSGRELRLDEESLRAIEERFRSIGREMTANNRKQALFPEGSTILPNPIGTAPGFICPVERGGRTRYIVCMPGVPREMRRMVDEQVLPWLAERGPEERFASRIFSTFGLGESQLDELLAGMIEAHEARVAFRAAFPRLQARLTVSGSPDEDLEARLDALEVRVRERLGHYLYAIGDEGMEETLGRLLREHGLTLAVAESCTGGLIGHRITDVPGSSAYFLLDVVSYANEAKEALLGVQAATLAKHGAVSVQTAEEMAAGVRQAVGADLGLATTGIAGPGGSTPDKPVGTVCVALAWEHGVWSKRYQLGDRGREWVKMWTAQIALDRVRRYLLGSLEKEDA
ncbi:MAG TPA: competence/damage-inducible protein A [Longimicrobiaceae bacterium]|nr:competence/damage-inducible protein A [Longimicrobiaceae bacterium]